MAKKESHITVRLDPEFKQHVEFYFPDYGQVSHEIREFLRKRTKFKPKKV